jgi:hypothetical protein
MRAYLRCRAFEHGHYYHYTTIDAINSILCGQAFWLSPLVGTNDRTEKALPAHFQTSFSTGESENLPLWYLYSGVDGKGGRLGLSKSHFKRLIEQAEYSLYEYNESGNLGERICDLDRNNSTLAVQDILYISEHIDGDYRLKYNGKQVFQSKFNGDLPQLITDYTIAYPAFRKSLIWFYEKETRWLVQVNESLLESDKEYRVVAKIPDEVFSQFQLTLAPEFADNEARNALLKRNGISKFLDEKIKFSQHKGEINMRICDKCAQKK